MTTSRRDALLYLGLVPAGTAALGTGAMTTPFEGQPDAALGSYGFVNDRTGKIDGGVDPKKMADAFRRLADGIERDEINWSRLWIGSEISPDKWVEQHMSFSFTICVSDKQS